MRIAVFSPDTPYPPDRGGRADIWRRIVAFRKLGHEVLLVNLQEPVGPLAPTDGDLAVVDSVVSRRFSFHIKRGLVRTVRQLAFSRSVPWHVANRVPDAEEWVQLSAAFANFKADFIWLDGPWFGLVASKLSRRHEVPVLYRSHNIEHLYIGRQADVAVRFRDRIAWHMACIGLERFEFQSMRSAAAVFDISVDDMAFWQKRGVGNSHWLPPLPELAVREMPSDKIDGEVVFVGNLGSPNNVRGVEFLLKQVLPLVRIVRPTVRCRLVGSNPTEHVRRWAAECGGVELCANVADPMRYLFGAAVLVNPVMSGSGVQVKMLDMLMTDAPIVTCTQGTRGLPAQFQNLFLVEDVAEGFADAICEALVRPCVDVEARRVARLEFALPAVARAVELAVNLGGRARSPHAEAAR